MLTSTATSMLRTSMGRSAGTTIQPLFFRSATVCPYSTAMVSTQRKPICASPLSTAAVVPKTLKPSPSTLILRTRPAQRSASTTTRPRTDAELDAQAAAEVAARAAAAAYPMKTGLDWDTFFKLRKQRRRLQQVFSLVMAAGFTAAGATFLIAGGAETLASKVPLDPFVTLGIMTLSCGTLGWLLGPFVGTAVFNATRSGVKAQMAIKESQFFARIKKNRVDPSASTLNNPLPDFYGEKISSVSGYRMWLKDQRAYLKKRERRL